MTRGQNLEKKPHQMLDRLRQQKAILAEFGRLAMQDIDLDSLLQDAAARAAAGTGIDHAKVLIYDPGRSDFLIRAGVGWDDSVVGKTHAPAGERSPPGRAYRTGQPVIVEDLPNDPSFDAHEPLKSHHIVSLVNVPIQTDAAIFGVLEVDADEKVKLGKDDIDFLHGFANLLAAGIERKSAEDAVRAAAEALARAAGERQILLQELQHRIANNFQSLIGFVHRLKKQAKTCDPDEILDALTEHLTGMAEAHSQLSSDQLPGNVMLGNYLVSLSANVIHHHPRVRLETDIHNTEISLDRAVTVGLILNEILTNALKHAFPGEASGTLHVEFTPDLGRNVGKLVVRDSGPGMGPPRMGGSGLRLISSLVDKLGGSIQRADNAGGGTRYELRFPLSTP